MSGLYVEVNGTGPDLVLLHGWGLNVRVWDGLVQDLSSRFRMIAVDLPGHGRSAWSAGRGTPAEQAWLLHTTLAAISNRYSLLGWSLGGQIGLDLAAAMPGQIDRLVLVAATPRFAAAPDWPYGMQPAVITKLATQLRTDYRRAVSDFLELQVRGSVEGGSVLEQLRQALLVHGQAKPEALEAGLNTLANSDLRPTLSHVKVPALVIAGQHDRITAPAAARALAMALPDARYVEMRRAAHAPFLSHKKEFATLVERFLRGADVSSDAAGSDISGTDATRTDTNRSAATSGVATAETAVADARTRNVAAGKAPAGRAAPKSTPPSSRAFGQAAKGTLPSSGAFGDAASKGGKARPAKKKRMKARARKKLRASSR
jgi:pimeloyl-[acyl-carrier protein] methyl ester esterase